MKANILEVIKIECKKFTLEFDIYICYFFNSINHTQSDKLANVHVPLDPIVCISHCCATETEKHREQ